MADVFVINSGQLPISVMLRCVLLYDKCPSFNVGYLLRHEPFYGGSVPFPSLLMYNELPDIVVYARIIIALLCLLLDENHMTCVSEHCTYLLLNRVKFSSMPTVVFQVLSFNPPQSCCIDML